MQNYKTKTLKSVIGLLALLQLFGSPFAVYAASQTKGVVTPKTQTKVQKKTTSEKQAPMVQEFQTVELIATAYYSPLPNQKYYLRGNYEAEIRLNGNGTHGASGKSVFMGMLAAPKSYSFGTKIWIEGLGIGSVEDRGGAIVNKGVRGYDSDRVDIWMGSGDEGLARALAWGKRKVKARIYANPATKVSLSFEGVRPANLAKSSAKIATNSVSTKTASTSPKTSKTAALTTTAKVEPIDELERKIQAYNREVKRVQKILDTIGTPEIGDVGPNIRVIQEVLIELGYLKVKSTAIYGEVTKQAVLEFQRDAALIIDVKDPNGGILGKLTREKLAEKIVYEGIEI